MAPAALSFLETTRIIEAGMVAKKAERRFADLVVDAKPLYRVVRAEGFDYISAIWLDDPDIARLAVRRLLGDQPPDAPGGRVAMYVCPECGDLGCGAVTAQVNRTEDNVEWSAWGLQNNYEERVTPVENLPAVTFRRDEYERALRALLAELPAP
ncbi:MAG TPA: hypothetical protein VK988_05920 [Acidimicrobiales bacterium]|nr:hypothetical protein [Acidimicrobiales bacterium]